MTQSEANAGYSVGRRVKIIKTDSPWFGQTGLIRELQQADAVVRLAPGKTAYFLFDDLHVLGAR